MVSYWKQSKEGSFVSFDGTKGKTETKIPYIHNIFEVSSPAVGRRNKKLTLAVNRIQSFVL